MKITLERETDVNDAQILINWLDIALKQTGGKNGSTQTYTYFESVIMASIIQYRETNPEPLIQEEIK